MTFFELSTILMPLFIISIKLIFDINLNKYQIAEIHKKINSNNLTQSKTLQKIQTELEYISKEYLKHINDLNIKIETKIKD